LAFFTFYKGYYGLCKGPSHHLAVKIYYVSQITACAFWFMFIFIRSGAFNGLFKLPILVTCELKFSVFLAAVEIVSYLASFLLGIFHLYCVRKYYGKDPYE